MTLVKKIGVCAVTLMVALAAVGPAFAQDKKAEEAAALKHKQDIERIEAEAKKYTYSWGGPALGAGLGAGLVIIGAGLGFGRIGSSALESMARQPETAAKVQTAMIIIGALLEGATFFALIVTILLAGK